MTEDRVLKMSEVAKRVGIRSPRILREKLRAIHAERGDVLTKVNNHYYVTESALRNLFPQLFSNTRSKVDDRFDTMQARLDFLESILTETKKNLYQARTRIRKLEAKLK